MLEHVLVEIAKLFAITGVSPVMGLLTLSAGLSVIFCALYDDTGRKLWRRIIAPPFAVASLGGYALTWLMWEYVKSFYM